MFVRVVVRITFGVFTGSFTGLTNATRFPITNVTTMLRYYYATISFLYLYRYFRNLYCTRIRYDKTIMKKLSNVIHVYVGNVLLSPKYWRIIIYSKAFKIKFASVYLKFHETYYGQLFRLQNTHKWLFKRKSFFY